MSYTPTIAVTQLLNEATLGATLIIGRPEVDALLQQAFTAGRNSVPYRDPAPTVMTFEGKRIDPDKLSALLADLKYLSAIHRKGAYYGVDRLVGKFDALNLS